MRLVITTRTFSNVLIALSVIGLVVLSLHVGFWQGIQQAKPVEASPSIVQPPKAEEHVAIPKFQECCPVETSFTFSRVTPQFSICLHPRGKDYILSDWTYNDNGSGDGLFENGLRKEMLKLLEPGSVVLDIGANIGLHSLFLANAGYKVHAFEPMHANFNLLKCSAVSNDIIRQNLVLNNFGLGDKVTTTCIANEDRNFGSARIQNDATSCAPENTIQVRRLDDYLATNDVKPFLVKIDVEGYEFKALEPAKEYFRKNPPKHIFAEFNTRHFSAAGSDGAKFLEFLWDLGYKIKSVKSAEVKKGDEAYTTLLDGNIHDIHATLA
ncbi:hypothetical protein HDU79_006583 [Rhizoclosmatium sp. JEL0117]|nr:hypothetical protein HDU79_006583 [Rhizoclosmatium sp. JEL0117]